MVSSIVCLHTEYALYSYLSPIWYNYVGGKFGVWIGQCFLQFLLKLLMTLPQTETKRINLW